MSRIRHWSTRRWFRRVGEDKGNILVLAALSMTFLCGLLALSIDVGRIFHAKREVQTLADAAALAAGLEVPACGATSNCDDMQSAAKSALVENGIPSDSITVVTQCGTGADTGVTLYVGNPPCWLGANDPYNGKASYAEAVVSYHVPTIFGALLGKSNVTVQARSEAGGAKPRYCIYVLGSGNNAMTVNGNATLTANCGIIVDSNATPAANFNGGDKITSTELDIVGTVLNNGNNTINPAPSTGAKSVADPLSALATPTVGSCGTSTASPYSGATNQVIINGNANATLNPGVYCNGITINGNATATFNAGTYIIKNGMIINGGDTVSGSGITLYFKSGSLTMNGNSHAVFSAPTSGTYEGILYFQDRADSNTVIINGDSSSKWEGVIYTPDSNLTLNGGANVAAYTDIVASTLTENGNVNFTIGSDYTSLPHGSPIKKHLITYPVE